jgi:ribosomal protein L21E
MELVDMKLPKRTKEELKKEFGPCTIDGGQEEYPWGLQLRFETEQIAKIPSLTDYKVGDKVSIQAEAVITSIQMSERQGGKESHTVEMQIHQISCSPVVKKPVEKMSAKEYRKARESKSI